MFSVRKDHILPARKPSSDVPQCRRPRLWLSDRMVPESPTLNSTLAGLLTFGAGFSEMALIQAVSSAYQ